MGVFEYLWVDSKENQEKYKEEKETETEGDAYVSSQT